MLTKNSIFFLFTLLYVTLVTVNARLFDDYCIINYTI